MAFFSAVGALKMRMACSEDWDGKLHKLQEGNEADSAVAHIVILTTYQDDEQILRQSLENIGRSTAASTQIYVVLAMEDREGVAAQNKAKNLIGATSDLFAQITASIHPEGLSNGAPAKSSNIQWAFKHALKTFAAQLSNIDRSRVILSVGDGGTLWHPQFFSSLAYSALQMKEAERVWTIWQPPVLRTRNLFSVPGPTRVSGLGSMLHELSGLANQRFGTHTTNTSYSLTLALASHPDVDGWDVDVVAEDQHMFCKCYYASLWESARAMRQDTSLQAADVVPKLQLEPIWLPAVSYLAESSDGYVASLHERFVEAQRHSSGVAELGYVMLQYIQLVLAVGLLNLPRKTHMGILSIVGKMYTEHIASTAQACSLVIAVIATMPSIVAWLVKGGFAALLAGEAFAELGWEKWVLFSTLGPLPLVAMVSASVLFVVVSDLIHGTYDLPSPNPALIGQESEERQPEQLGFIEKALVAAIIQHDIVILAEPALLVYGMLPKILAAWSLMRKVKLEYLVGAKMCEARG